MDNAADVNNNLGHNVDFKLSKNKSKGYMMGCLNIKCLNRHIDELRVFVADNYSDVVAINETKLDGTICDEQISLPGFNCLRRDRDKFGGGVCIFVRDSLMYSRICDPEISYLIYSSSYQQHVRPPLHTLQCTGGSVG